MHPQEQIQREKAVNTEIKKYKSMEKGCLYID